MNTTTTMTISTTKEAKAALYHLILVSAVFSSTVNAHGYVKSPRSRNFVANQDGKEFGGTSSDPAKEYCPHCLNLGGSLAACGMVGGRNYDYPRNSMGGSMPVNVQAYVAHGGEMDFQVVLTAHHKGHFSFYACPVTSGSSVPTDACFKAHPLEFVQDLLYGATKDPNYPDRAYLPPLTYAKIVSDSSGPIQGTLYRYRMKLPDNVQGDLVLVQWHYVTANSCKPEGYNGYSFPSDWPNLNYASVSTCDHIPADGNGTPEQFWNCVEISVNGNGGGNPPPPPPPSRPPPTPPVAPPVAPPSPSGGTCGGGSRGDGNCADGSCCSQWGWCGSSPEHCGGGPLAPTPPVPTPPSAGGNCGGGTVGNGVCPHDACCSQWGWCGYTDAHCGE